MVKDLLTTFLNHAKNSLPLLSGSRGNGIRTCSTAEVLFAFIIRIKKNGKLFIMETF
jgi:hypothetical protein